MDLKASPSSQREHCTDEAQKDESVVSAVIYMYMYVCMYVYIYITADTTVSALWASSVQC